MAKTKADMPATMTGRVIGRLDEIETWFREGFKTHEVRARLATEGIRLSRVKFTALLSSYGKSELQVRRTIAAESGAVIETSTPPATPRPTGPGVAEPLQHQRHSDKPPATGAGNTTSAAAALKRREAERGRTFRPDPSPRGENLI